MAVERTARRITTPQFPDEWQTQHPDLVEGLQEVFASLNGGQEGEDELYKILVAIGDNTANLGVFSSRLDETGAIATDAINDFGDSLSSINALTPSANEGFYWTSPTAAALFSITPFARTILDDTAAGDVRTTIGLAAQSAIPAPDAISGYSAATIAGPTIAEVQTIADALETLRDQVASLRTSVLAIESRLQSLDLIS